MTLIILLIICVLLYLITETMIFHPKSSPDIINQKYAPQDDCWIRKNNNDKLFIMLHGMSADPVQYSPLDKNIVDGWDIYVPTLPSANRLPFEQYPNQYEHSPYQWEDGLRVAAHKILKHSKGYKEVVLCGHSLGGSKALAIAPSMPFIKKIIVIASPINFLNTAHPIALNMIGIFSGFLHFLPQKGLNICLTADEFHHGIAVHSYKYGLNILRKNLSKISSENYLIYHQKDKVIPIGNGIYFSKHLPNVKDFLVVDDDQSSEEHRHTILDNPHVNEEVYKKINSILTN